MKSFKEWLNEAIIRINGIEYDTENVIDCEELDRMDLKNNSTDRSGNTTTIISPQQSKPINFSAQSTIIKKRIPSFRNTNINVNWNSKGKLNPR